MDKNPKNKFNLEVYNQVNELVKFSSNVILSLERLDLSDQVDYDKKLEVSGVKNIENKFILMRKKFEEVYAKTRILERPETYILDQDHHDHPANQSKNFDWQFFSELFLIEKLKENYKNML